MKEASAEAAIFNFFSPLCSSCKILSSAEILFYLLKVFLKFWQILCSQYFFHFFLCKIWVIPVPIVLFYVSFLFPTFLCFPKLSQSFPNCTTSFNQTFFLNLMSLSSWIFKIDISIRRCPPLSMDIISRHFFTPLLFFCNWILHIWNGFYTWSH